MMLKIPDFGTMMEQPARTTITPFSMASEISVHLSSFSSIYTHNCPSIRGSTLKNDLEYQLYAPCPAFRGGKPLEACG
jgi:hypothetical protein